MFERFTDPARDVVVGAQAQARELDHRVITTPHLLLALLEGEGGDLLRAHGVTAEQARRALADLIRPDAEGSAARGTGPDRDDDDAAVLAAIGIDIARIRAAVEANFGPGALDHPPSPPDGPGLLARLGRIRHRRTGPGRTADEVATLRRSTGRASGHIPFSPPAKKSLELSLREALRLGNRRIGPEHLTLGLLRCSDGAAAVVLDRLGVDVAAVRQDAEQRLRRTA